jgi:hypothetical protein
MTSVIKVDTIQNSSGGAVGIGDLGLTVDRGIVNVYQALNTSASTLTGVSGQYVDVQDLSITLTPQSTSSKFLITARVFGEAAGTDGHDWSMALFDGSSHINSGDAAGNRLRVICTAGSDHDVADSNSTPQTWNATTLYAPASTAERTIKVTMNNQGGTSTLALNKTQGDGDSNSFERGSSELIILEIVL